MFTHVIKQSFYYSYKKNLDFTSINNRRVLLTTTVGMAHKRGELSNETSIESERKKIKMVEIENSANKKKIYSLLNSNQQFQGENEKIMQISLSILLTPSRSRSASLERREFELLFIRIHQQKEYEKKAS